MIFEHLVYASRISAESRKQFQRAIAPRFMVIRRGQWLLFINHYVVFPLINAENASSLRNINNLLITRVNHTHELYSIYTYGFREKIWKKIRRNIYSEKETHSLWNSDTFLNILPIRYTFNFCFHADLLDERVHVYTFDFRHHQSLRYDKKYYK